MTENVAEKDITLAVALALRKELAKENNLEVVLTRDSDKELIWKTGKKYCKDQTGFVLSLHTNAGFGTRKSAAQLNKEKCPLPSTLYNWNRYCKIPILNPFILKLYVDKGMLKNHSGTVNYIFNI